MGMEGELKSSSDVHVRFDLQNTKELARACERADSAVARSGSDCPISK
jgi:hypothetical protein